MINTCTEDIGLRNALSGMFTGLKDEEMITLNMFEFLLEGSCAFIALADVVVMVMLGVRGDGGGGGKVEG